MAAVETGTRRQWPAWVQALGRQEDLPRLLALMGLFLLVVCALGILRPIKNALALDGLGASNFYQVYLVSAVVVGFVPIFHALSRRLPARLLFALFAWFFALNLVVLRLLYQPGSGAFGLVFYGWYDLFAAALVTQFFMATQFYFDARSAKRAYPVVIAGGSIGAALGGGITGLFAESLGTPNLLLVAGALVMVFAAGIPFVLADRGDVRAAARRVVAASAAAAKRRQRHGAGLRELWADRQVRLIAAAVLLTVVVKQLVDYEFQALTQQVFVTRDAISAFQGKFNAATQWLPLVMLVGLRPALRRWGIAVAVLVLPLATLGATVALALTFGLWAAAVAKGAETSLRYSAERAGRELLYIPVRDDIKLGAKAYIDVAVEKGLGKIVAALLIMALVQFLDFRGIAWVTAGLAAAAVALALGMRREYTRTLARSIENRFASFRGVFASLVNGSTLPVLQKTLAHGSPGRRAFALELLDQAEPGDLKPLAPELNRLTAHERAEIRALALRQLARIPAAAELPRVRERLRDEAEEVREAAVQVLVAESGSGAPALLNELLRDESPGVRTAALRCLAATCTPPLRAVGRAYVEARWSAGRAADADTRAELALATGGLQGDAEAGRFLAPFLEDEDPRVRSTALRSAALLGRADCCGLMIRALGEPETREAARDALTMVGEPAVAPLAAALLDPATPQRVRMVIPSTLARIPTPLTVDAMLRLVLAPETDQLLDFRTLRALGRLHARHPGLHFDPALVWEVALREGDHAARYAAVRAGLPRFTQRDSVTALFAAALEEGVRERTEGVFRCLALLYPAEPVLHAHAAVSGGSSTQRANAIEWVEQTVGPLRARRLLAALEAPPGGSGALPAARLHDDGDPWIAHLAKLYSNPKGCGMELIEKVFLLQQVDLLRGARGAHVALLASIAEEIDAPADTVLLEAGAPPAAMYVVARGSVELHGVGERLVVGEDGAFGTWALIDEQPSPVEARTLEPTRLLRVTRSDFHDLLADHTELALGLLQGLAHRVRTLVA